MASNQKAIQQLIERLEMLSRKQEAFKYEIFELKNKIDLLAAEELEKNATDQKLENQSKISTDANLEEESTNSVQKKYLQKEIPNKPKEVFNYPSTINSEPSNQTQPEQSQNFNRQTRNRKSNLEKFIGENLLNKIGILITIIGVGIGAKYSIENELISPLTRIILGYLSALGLLGFGIKLKKKYEDYSAVLVSGATVILYFITFFAYSFYELIPQTVAFILMVVFTIFTVVASLNYNRQIIAHLGLVGAYAVPFLLSDGSGKVAVLFSYMAIINIGILVISFKKYWKLLYYTAFGLTWLIFSWWFVLDYRDDAHFILGLTFSTTFHIIFYLTFLAYKLFKKEAFASTDIVLLLLNSFIFYVLGYAILSDHETGQHYLGLFTLFNAVIHFIVAAFIFKQNLSDKKLFYLATALVLTFISIAIPVQLDGNWVTLLWTIQAALLFWIGTSKQIAIYEKLSYPLMVLAFLSLLEDWQFGYLSYYNGDGILEMPIWNTYFLGSVLFLLIFGTIVYLQTKKNFVSSLKSNEIAHQIVFYGVPLIFIFSLYYAFRLELAFYFDQWYDSTEITIGTSGGYDNTLRDWSLKDFKAVWIINYTLFFLSALAYYNHRKIKNKALEIGILVTSFITILVFLVQGLYALSDLREVYIETSEYFNRGVFYLIIRYISFVFLAMAMTAFYRFIKKEGVQKGWKIAYDALLHITIVWVVSSELIHWLDLAGAKGSYKLGLSILWGVYSFLLIGFGIWKGKPYLRIGGMGLFAITLIKLFFYDIAHLNTISKTIVFVSLGVLLLIISFLYNKYKSQIIYPDNNSEIEPKQNKNQESAYD